jgi:glutamyl-tRNA reductase
MTRRCGRALHEAGIPLYVVNRSLEAAAALAAELDAKALTLEQFRAAPPSVSAALVATGSAEPVVDRAALRRVAIASTALRPLFVDFSSPNNVDPRDAEAAGIERVGMDELVAIARERRLAHLVRLAPVRAAIDERLAHLRSELATRAIGPRLAALRHTSEQLVAAEVEHLLSTELRALDGRSQDAVRRWAVTLSHRLAHLQLSGVRAAAEHASSEALDAFFEGARLRSSTHDES